MCSGVVCCCGCSCISVLPGAGVTIHWVYCYQSRWGLIKHEKGKVWKRWQCCCFCAHLLSNSKYSEPVSIQVSFQLADCVLWWLKIWSAAHRRLGHTCCVLVLQLFKLYISALYFPSLEIQTHILTEKILIVLSQELWISREVFSQGLALRCTTGCAELGWFMDGLWGGTHTRQSCPVTYSSTIAPPRPTVPLVCAQTRQSQLGPSTVAYCLLSFSSGVGSLASVPWPEHISTKCTEATEWNWTWVRTECSH